MRKMMKGEGVNIPLKQMGSDKGDVVVMLHPQNARKMLTAYKKGKGMRLKMSAPELEHTVTKGRGFDIGKAFDPKRNGVAKAFDKAGKDIKGAISTVDSGIKRGISEADKGIKIGVNETKKAVDEYGRPVAGIAIRQGVPMVTGMVGSTLGGPLGGIAGSVAGEYAGDALAKKVGVGLYAGKGMHPDDAKKQYMAMIRSMRGMSAEEKAKVKGSGLFQFLHSIGIKKKDAIGKMKEAGKKAVRYGATAVGTALGTAVGNPIAGAMLGEALGRAGEMGIDSVEPTRKGIRIRKNDSISNLKKDMGQVAEVALEKVIKDEVPAEYQDVAVNALQQKKKRLGLGVKVTRGKGVASMSSAYKKAMKANYDGLVLSEVDGNAPISQFSTNPMVKPAGDEMTLSPHQNITSPAMNPFIPKYYTQMGGTQSGYGGRGLF